MSEATFRKKAPWVMELLMADFPWGLEDAAACVGNGGHESNGLEPINEVKPTVSGSRGGFSWFQWTGPRRVAFESYCARNGLDVRSDAAAYKFLFVELKGTEKSAVSKTATAEGLEAKVKAFELGYERAGVKHYPSRLKWAQIALEAYANAQPKDKLPPWAESSSVAPPAPVPAPTPVIVAPVTPAAPEAPAEPLPANPHPTPVEQASKAIGAGKWAALIGVLWTGVVAMGVLPAPYDTPEFIAAVGSILSALAGLIGSYVAPANAVPVKPQ